MVTAQLSGGGGSSLKSGGSNNSGISSSAGGGGSTAAAARRRLVASVSAQLESLGFANVAEVYVYLDADGESHVSRFELTKGLRALGCAAHRFTTEISTPFPSV
jgi:hypothetical protein